MSKFHKDKLYLIKDFLEEKLESLKDTDGYVWRDEVLVALLHEQEMYELTIAVIEDLIKE